MRLLADENVPAAAVEALRALGHDVAWVRTDAPGSSDVQVIGRAMREERVLFTLDKDFGELAFLRGLPATCGVILLRVAPLSPDHLASIAANALSSRADWAGHFSVVEPGSLRMIRLSDPDDDARG